MGTPRTQNLVLHTNTEAVEWAIAGLQRLVAQDAFGDIKPDAPVFIKQFLTELERSYHQYDHLTPQ